MDTYVLNIQVQFSANVQCSSVPTYVGQEKRNVRCREKQNNYIKQDGYKDINFLKMTIYNPESKRDTARNEYHSANVCRRDVGPKYSAVQCQLQ